MPNAEEEDVIREEAHRIWETEGRPNGRHEEHWKMAEDAITQRSRNGASNQTPGAKVEESRYTGRKA